MASGTGAPPRASSRSLGRRPAVMRLAVLALVAVLAQAAACDKGQYKDPSGVCKTCQRGRHQNEAKSASVCKLCRTGRYQNDVGTTWCKVCPAGKAHTNGKTAQVSPSVCVNCARGKYQDSALGKGSCKDCPPWQFQDAVAASGCKVCPAGRYRCDPHTFDNTLPVSDACKLCPAGTYQDTAQTEGDSAESCKLCGAGRANAKTGQKLASTCAVCAVDKYTEETGQTACKACDGTRCPAGRYLIGGAQANCKGDSAGSCAGSCPAGRYRIEAGDRFCKRCDIGRFAWQIARAACTKCPAGKFASATGASLCSLCAVGKSRATTGASNCASCEQGEYQHKTGQAECERCPAGKYRTEVTTTATNTKDVCATCQSGRYRGIAGTTACALCGAGWFRNEVIPASSRKSEACWRCQPGQFQPKEGQTSCESCGAGLRVGGNTKELGYFEKSASENCVSCAAGRAKSADAKMVVPVCAECGPRPYACKDMCTKNGNARGYCSKCDAADGSRGACCKKGADGDPTECAKADERLFAGVGSHYMCIVPDAKPFECMACAEGQFQMDTGKDACISCAAGKFRNQAGAEAKEEDACSECPAGKFQDHNGQQQCKLCPRGQYRHTNSAANATCTKCPIGKYQDQYAQLECKPCARGQFSNSIASQMMCSECEAGRFQNKQNQSSCKNCPAAQYQEQERMHFCKSCRAGQYSVAGNVPRTSCLGDACRIGKFSAAESPTSQVTCEDCAEGKYAASPGSAICAECPIGKFQADAAKGVCNSCRNGKTTLSNGTAAASDCECNSALCCGPGFYKASEGDLECKPCQPGQFQGRSGQDKCVDCAVGKYSVDIEASFCNECEAGKAGRSIEPRTAPGHCAACPAGQHKSKQGQAWPCDECLAGTRANEEGLRECVRCPAGWMQGQKGQTRCDRCQSGRFASLSGQDGCAACFLGQYQPDTGGKGCIECTVGRFHNATAPSTAAPELACLACPHGKFQPSLGNAQCKVCVAGQHGGSEPVTSERHCKQCAKGRFAAKEGEPECKMCSKGTYAPAGGAAECTECAAGSAADSAGLSACTDCTAGRVAPSARTSECRTCESGRSQGSDGRTTCATCKTGWFSAAGASNCSLCEAGRFWRSPTCTSCEACPAGAVRASCGGANSGVCIKCSLGRFQSGQECTECPAGKYQDESGQGACVPCAGTGYCHDHAFRQGCGRAAPGFCSNYTTCSAGRFQVLAPSISSDRKCQQCAAGKYQDGLDQRACKACQGCQTGARFACGGTFQGFCLNCPSGKFMKDGDRCVDCEAGRWCAGGTSHKCGGANQFCPANSSSPTSVNIGHFSVPEGPDEDERQGEKACPTGYNCRRGMRAECAAGRVCRLTEQRILDFTANGTVQITVEVASQEPCKEREFAFNGTCVPCPAQGAKCSEGLIELEPNFWYDAKHGSIGEFWWKRHAGQIDTAYNIYRCAPGACGAADFCESDGAGGSVCKPGVAKCTDGRSGALCAVCLDGYFADATMGCKECPTDSLGAAGMLGMLVFVGALAYGGYRAARALELRHPRMAAAVKEKLPQILKLCTGMYQILAAFGTVFHAVPWPHAFSAMSKGLSLLTLDVFAFPSLRCSAWGDSYYKRFDVHVGTMLAVTLVFVALLFFAYSEWNHARRAPLKPAKVWSAFLPFLFIIYPSISQTVILMLRCREVDGMSFLLSDFSLRCDTPEYGAHQAYALFGVLVFPVGILAVFTAVVGYSRKKLPPDWWPHGADLERDAAFVEYEDRSEQSGVVEVLSEAQWTAQVWEERMTKYTRMDDRFGFLFGAYSKKCWWFESVFTVYKLLMTVGILFVSDETPNKILFGMLGATSMMALAAFYQPFKHPDVLSINTMSQFVILLVLFAAQYFLLNGDSSWVVTACLIVLTLTPLVASVFLTLRLPKGADGGREAGDGFSTALAARMNRAKSATGTAKQLEDSKGSRRKLLRHAIGSARMRAATNRTGGSSRSNADVKAATAAVTSSAGATGGARCAETGVLFHDVFEEGAPAGEFSGVNPLHLSANPKHLSAQNGDKTMLGDSAPSPPKLTKQGSQLVLGGKQNPHRHLGDDIGDSGHL